MRRLLVMLAILALAAGAAYAVMGLTGTGPHPLRVVGTGTNADLSDVALQADRHVTPLSEDGLRPGTSFRYSFKITNTGETKLRHVAVRSVLTALPAAGTRPAVTSVSGPMCWGIGHTGHTECIFHHLNPGETHTVRVTAQTSAQSRPGDWLIIHTFAGRFSGSTGGPVTLQVETEPQASVGRFR